jgi:hypothetical protein
LSIVIFVCRYSLCVADDEPLVCGRGDDNCLVVLSWVRSSGPIYGSRSSVLILVVIAFQTETALQLLQSLRESMNSLSVGSLE